MSRVKPRPLPEQFHVTREQRDFCRRRIGFLLDRDGPTRPLIDLLANAYTQGLIDATEMTGRTPRAAERDVITIGAPQ